MNTDYERVRKKERERERQDESECKSLKRFQILKFEEIPK